MPKTGVVYAQNCDNLCPKLWLSMPKTVVYSCIIVFIILTTVLRMPLCMRWATKPVYTKVTRLVRWPTWNYTNTVNMESQFVRGQAKCFSPAALVIKSVFVFSLDSCVQISDFVAF